MNLRLSLSLSLYSIGFLHKALPLPIPKMASNSLITAEEARVEWDTGDDAKVVWKPYAPEIEISPPFANWVHVDPEAIVRYAEALFRRFELFRSALGKNAPREHRLALEPIFTSPDDVPEVVPWRLVLHYSPKLWFGLIPMGKRNEYWAKWLADLKAGDTGRVKLLRPTAPPERSAGQTTKDYSFWACEQCATEVLVSKMVLAENLNRKDVRYFCAFPTEKIAEFYILPKRHTKGENLVQNVAFWNFVIKKVIALGEEYHTEHLAVYGIAIDFGSWTENSLYCKGTNHGCVELLLTPEVGKHRIQRGSHAMAECLRFGTWLGERCIQEMDKNLLGSGKTREVPKIVDAEALDLD
jgi:hypothetical protein